MSRIKGDRHLFRVSYILKMCLSPLIIMGIVFMICQKNIEASNQVCFKGQCINVEIMRTRQEHSRGLQFRKTLDADSGMLFVFEKSYPYSFWMKDTLIPLDIIWIDESKKVIHIAHNVPPCKELPCPTYIPLSKALYILEVNAGYANKLGLQVGDIIKI